MNNVSLKSVSMGILACITLQAANNTPPTIIRHENDRETPDQTYERVRAERSAEAMAAIDNAGLLSELNRDLELSALKRQTNTEYRYLQRDIQLHDARTNREMRRLDRADDLAWNRTNRTQDFAMSIVEENAKKVINFFITRAVSLFYGKVYPERMKAQKAGALAAARLEAQAQMYANQMQRIRDNQQIQLNDAQLLITRQKLLNEYAATTDEEKDLHKKLRANFASKLTDHFGLRQPESPAPTVYMIPAPKAKPATPPAPADLKKSELVDQPS